MIEIKVAELMGKHKLTKKQLSMMTGIRPNTISALWYGTAKRIDIRQLDALCKALKCQPGDLLVFVEETEGDKNGIKGK